MSEDWLWADSFWTANLLLGRDNVRSEGRDVRIHGNTLLLGVSPLRLALGERCRTRDELGACRDSFSAELNRQIM